MVCFEIANGISSVQFVINYLHIVMTPQKKNIIFIVINVTEVDILTTT